MAGISAIDNAYAAINQQFDRLAKTGEKVARYPADTDIPGAMVDMMSTEHEVKAQTAVIKTADEMYESLLDIIA